MTKDYYKILGITEFETTENIKTAYHRLARKFHPDIAGNSAETLIKFKEINEAYEILSNKVKKEEYDKARSFYHYAKKQTNYNKTTSNNVNKEENNNQEKNKHFTFNWEEIIYGKKRENSYNKTKQNTPEKGSDIYSDIDITIFEAINGTTKTVNMLHTQVCPKCNGKKFVNGSICGHCNGKGENAIYKKFTVKIPKDIKNKSKIRLAGEGNPGKNGGINGDLYLTINIVEPKNYKTEGLNILKTIPITPYEAVLGTDVKISTLNGNVLVKIAPKTQNGQKIRLAGYGISQNNKIGDMIITVEIKLPSKISDEEIALYKKLEEISNCNVRENLYDY